MSELGPGLEGREWPPNELLVVGVSSEAIARELGAWQVVGVVCGDSQWGREFPELPVVCVCVCESMSEREKERKREKGRERGDRE